MLVIFYEILFSKYTYLSIYPLKKKWCGGVNLMATGLEMEKFYRKCASRKKSDLYASFQLGKPLLTIRLLETVTAIQESINLFNKWSV